MKVVSKLNLKSWFFLFITTLLLGGFTMILTNVVIGWADITGGADATNELVAAGIWLFIVGLMFSVISQMGFFAYLMIHRFGLSIFKTYKLWNLVQVVLILFVLFDLVYFRYLGFGGAWTDYLFLPFVLLIVALGTAYAKVKLTNWTAFIPTVFFVTVVTTVEAVPAIIQNDPVWVTLMTTTLLVCNVYQVLVLQSLLKGKA